MLKCLMECLAKSETIGFGVLIGLAVVIGALVALAVALPPAAPVSGAAIAKITGTAIGLGVIAAIIKCLQQCRDR